MSGSFNVGDVVVCADDSPCRCCGRAWPVRVGSVHKVTRVGRGFNRPKQIWVDAVWLAGWKGTAGHPPEQGVNAARFQHLPKAAEEFTAEMRACRPVRQTVPA